LPTITEKIALTREQREQADSEFRDALRNARASGLSWAEIATVAGMSLHGVRYLANNENEQRKAARKGENGAG
jgi:hypothetical protein